MAETKEEREQREDFERKEDYRKYKEACEYLDKKARETDTYALEQALRGLGGSRG